VKSGLLLGFGVRKKAGYSRARGHKEGVKKRRSSFDRKEHISKKG